MKKENLLTVNQVAERLQLKPATIHKYIRDGKINAIKLGGKVYRISEEDLMKFITEQKKE